MTSNGGNANSLLEPSGSSGKTAAQSYGAAFNNDALGTDVHRGLNPTSSDGLASAFGNIDLAGVANSLARPSTAALPPHSSRNGLNSLQAITRLGLVIKRRIAGAGDLLLQAQQALLQQQAAQQAQINQFSMQQMQYNTNAGGAHNLQQQGLGGGAGNLPGFDTSAVNQVAANGGTVAEVYQAAYAAALYAQQQQLQHLVRMQSGAGMVNPQNMAFPGGNVNAAAAAAAAAAGMNGIGGAYGDTNSECRCSWNACLSTQR